MAPTEPEPWAIRSPVPGPPAERPPVVEEEEELSSAIGRLVAVIVTCGLGWALTVAIGIWLLAFLISRLA